MPVVISPNIKKTREYIDVNGNTVVPHTKEIIKSVNEDNYVPTPEELKGITNPQPPQPSPEAQNATVSNPLSIQEQIDQAKENLAKLEELKKLKIAEMKAQLELLQSE